MSLIFYIFGSSAAMKGARPLLRVLAAPIVLLRGGFQVANGLPAGCTAATFKRRQEHVALKLRRRLPLILECVRFAQRETCGDMHFKRRLQITRRKIVALIEHSSMALL
jgi:hypothetical protein